MRSIAAAQRPVSLRDTALSQGMITAKSGSVPPFRCAAVQAMMDP